MNSCFPQYYFLQRHHSQISYYVRVKQHSVASLYTLGLLSPSSLVG